MLGNVFSFFRNKPLSAKTIYGLADLAFFNFCKLDCDYSQLGIHFQIIPFKEKISKLEQEKDRKNGDLEQLLSFDWEPMQSERSVIAGALRSFYKFEITGKSRSDPRTPTIERVNDIYMLFIASFLHCGNADRIFDWFLHTPCRVSLSSNNYEKLMNIICNTIKWYFSADAEHPPASYPDDVKFIRKNLLQTIK